MSYTDKCRKQLSLVKLYGNIYIHAFIDVYEYTWKTTSENLQV